MAFDRVIGVGGLRLARDCNQIPQQGRYPAPQILLDGLGCNKKDAIVFEEGVELKQPRLSEGTRRAVEILSGDSQAFADNRLRDEKVGGEKVRCLTLSIRS